jgi:hypothetical protein
MITRRNVQATWNYIKRDHESWPFRFWLEVFAWALSIGAALLFALTVPAVPFFVFLTMTITGSAVYAWAAWTRGSFGMLANYVALTAIDTVGFVRLLA